MVATPLSMLPSVDDTADDLERERAERRLERERRRRAQGKPVYLEDDAADGPTAIIRRRDLELPVEEPPIEGELPGAQRGLARSGVIFAVATGLSRIFGLVREIAQAAV